MKEPALVIVKPDGISKGLIGPIVNKFLGPNLEIIGVKITNATRQIAEEHYKHIKGQPFFKGTINYFMGNGYKRKQLLAIIYHGENAIKKCRKIAGATSPEDADPLSIRGAYGRITTKGIYENVVHVSSDQEEAEREIKLWFAPDEITRKLYPSKIIKLRSITKQVWDD